MWSVRFSLSTLTTKVAEEDNNIYLYLCKENLTWNPVCLEKLMYITIYSSARTSGVVDSKNLFSAASKRFGHNQYRSFFLMWTSLLSPDS
jgi:hypothetical protein